MANTPISRRQFMKTAAAATAGIGLTALPAVGQAKAFGVPALLQTREINMVGWSSDPLKAIMARSEKEIGVKINYDVLPSKWSDVMQKITLWGQTGYAGIDVLFADDLISGLWGMNGWAEDLSGLDAWTKNKDDVVDNINVLNTAVGGVYRIFMFMGLEPFYYNKSMTPTPPATWDELVSMGKAATKDDGSVWGWRPLGGEGHAFNTVLLALNQAGADLETLNDPATLAALKFMQDWVITDKITPPSTVSEDNPTVEALAAAGRAAMWWSYDSAYSNVLTIEDTVLTKDNLGIARWPKGPAADTGLVHGWGYLMPKASANKDAAKEVINWLAQPDLIRDVDIASNNPPPYKSLLTDATLNEKLPILTAGPGWEELIRGAKFREPIVNHQQVTQLWTMFDNLGKYVLSGEKTPEEAQSWAVEEYQTISSGG